MATKKLTRQSDRSKKHEPKTSEGMSFESLFGFGTRDLTSWDSFVRLMNRPTHPAGLAVFRVCYGVLMFMDCMDERGLSSALTRWGDSEQCRFPLLHGLQPLATHWMVVLHLVMTIATLGIIFGFMFRHCCLLFAVPYWFIFILEKMRWNNHSYLFGLVALILFVSDANRAWSLDGLIWPDQRNTHVPLWNYFIPRFQVFILFFIAGLKKFDADWTQGYSMNLSNKMAFAPFRLLFSAETIDQYMVHTCGHMVDLFLPYLLFFDKTRIIGFAVGISFNIMNATIFSIGVFSYMCIVSFPLFCYPDWPVQLARRLPTWLRRVAPLDQPPAPSEHCVYTKEAIDAARHDQTQKQLDVPRPGTKASTTGKSQRNKGGVKKMTNKTSSYHKWFTILTLCYAGEQLFLPYSHFITQGYNSWTQGLYGYSWDMMIHTWSVQFIKVQFVEKDTGEVGYLRTGAFTTRRNRWSSNADMIKQYASCVEQRLAARNKTNVAIYLDVWKSMNKRFQQRMVDPRVNILEAEWHPLKKTKWMMPLLIDLSNWREALRQIQTNTRNLTNYTNAVFVADFPGMHLSNFLQDDIGQTNLTVLEGEVIVEIEYEDKSVNTTLKKSETIDLPMGHYHNVYTVSPVPSCYYYVYEDLLSRLQNLNKTNLIAKLKSEQGVNDESELDLTVAPEDDNQTRAMKAAMEKQRYQKDSLLTRLVYAFVVDKVARITGVYDSLSYAGRVILGGEDPAGIMEQMRPTEVSVGPDSDADSQDD